MLRKSILGLGCAFAAFGFGGAAQAATITINVPAGTLFSMPVSCAPGMKTCPQNFDATGSFAAPAGATKAMVSFMTSALNDNGMYSPGFDINFFSADFNGSPITLTSSSGGNFEFGTSGFVNLGPTNTLNISGFGGADATITGNITFATPEPTTWALMLIGFGAIGAVIRRRRSQTGESLATA